MHLLILAMFISFILTKLTYFHRKSYTVYREDPYSLYLSLKNIYIFTKKF